MTPLDRLEGAIDAVVAMQPIDTDQCAEMRLAIRTAYFRLLDLFYDLQFREIVVRTQAVTENARANNL